MDNATRVDRVAQMEELKAQICAAQAIDTADLYRAVRTEHAAMGLPKDKHGVGVAAQVALARRESPTAGQAHLTLARAPMTEMPNALARMQDGVLSEYRAQIIRRGISHLDAIDRQAVDTTLCSEASRFAGWSDNRFETETRKAADLLDVEARLRRNKLAETQRRVTVRTAADGMAYLTALLPLKQAIAVKATLAKAAKWITSGEPRTPAQYEADLLVERVLGISRATDIPVSVGLVITDLTLLAGDDHPARVPGYGTIPGPIARQWIRDSVAARLKTWIRRLYLAPATGELVAMDSRRRLFPRPLAEFLDLRDDRCRTPYCGAPIKHHDHIIRSRHGGATSAEDGACRCEACNYHKEAPGFSEKPINGERHTFETRTPTGHTYESTAPPVI
ncbi:HNH endonuclease [Smaragdicoccus niigatensis]|uniref:HNH endonuclease n=2 Tax=Smaragdicoccus niigatensis TaxID=359359 RepID=UPI00039B6F24|nr:HNH endonuclease signature motif containing protein [Smaragdicoccus niigatensis]